LIEYYCGEVGLRPDEFWSMTFEELVVCSKGYEKREAKRKEIERFIAVLLNNTLCDRKFTPTEFYPLVTDKDRSEGLLTKEEYEKSQELLKNVKWQNSD
jgi:hypothetical protein